jgi:uncharacterized protein YbjT (DUF2867 family)
MRILLTGATGYIGKRLQPLLEELGHEVIPASRKLGIDLLDASSLEKLPKEIDVAYYLVHSMAGGGAFVEKDREAAKNFVGWLNTTSCKQLIYLGGLVTEERLSPHLASRLEVEEILRGGETPLTALRAGIVIGSGSASFEIIRDLVEKLPVMVAPKWVSSKCQPIAIRDLLFYLSHVVGNEATYGRTLEVGGPDVLTYKEMLLGFAKVRGLRRFILTVPVLTPHLSSYWLIFVTPTNFHLAMSLVASLKNNAVMSDHTIDQLLPHKCLSYEEALRQTLRKIEENAIVSSWTDSFAASRLYPNLDAYINVPRHGCLTDRQIHPIKGDPAKVLDRIWSIGGKTGWYGMDWAWKVRGRMDKMVGGVGLRRGRRHPTELERGDALDFWRVLLADKEKGRLLLYAEMKLPGEAWLELRVEGREMHQIATFRPRGVLGRLYWWALYPFHKPIFKKMAASLCAGPD